MHHRYYCARQLWRRETQAHFQGGQEGLTEFPGDSGRLSYAQENPTNPKTFLLQIASNRACNMRHLSVHAGLGSCVRQIAARSIVIIPARRPLASGTGAVRHRGGLRRRLSHPSSPSLYAITTFLPACPCLVRWLYRAFSWGHPPPKRSSSSNIR